MDSTEGLAAYMNVFVRTNPLANEYRLTRVGPGIHGTFSRRPKQSRAVVGLKLFMRDLESWTHVGCRLQRQGKQSPCDCALELT